MTFEEHYREAIQRGITMFEYGRSLSGVGAQLSESLEIPESLAMFLSSEAYRIWRADIVGKSDWPE